MEQYEHKEEIIDELKNMKMWILFHCEGSLKCEELRKQFEKIDGIEEFIRTRLVYGN